MSYMFFGCSRLEELNLINFNSNNVTNMYGIFFENSRLDKLNFINFNTNNVTTVKFRINRTTHFSKMGRFFGSPVYSKQRFFLKKSERMKKYNKNLYF